MLLRVSDLKQYAYCPRVIYYHYVMPVDSKPTFKMEYGKTAEDRIQRLEKRRKFKRYGLDNGLRHFGKWVVSEKLGLSGKMDLLIEQAEGRFYPVDFKMTEGGVRESHKLQIAGYAMILEDIYDVSIERGFIFLIEQEDVVPVELDDKLRSKCRKAVKEMRRMVVEESMPAPTAYRNRCTDCEYRNFCRDIW